jgi:hypothetical protein
MRTVSSIGYGIITISTHLSLNLIDDGDEDEEGAGSFSNKESCDNFDRLLDEVDEPDQLAIFFKESEPFADDQTLLAAYIRNHGRKLITTAQASSSQLLSDTKEKLDEILRRHGKAPAPGLVPLAASNRFSKVATLTQDAQQRMATHRMNEEQTRQRYQTYLNRMQNPAFPTTGTPAGFGRSSGAPEVIELLDDEDEAKAGRRSTHVGLGSGPPQVIDMVDDDEDEDWVAQMSEAARGNYSNPGENNYFSGSSSSEDGQGDIESNERRYYYDGNVTSCASDQRADGNSSTDAITPDDDHQQANEATSSDVRPRLDGSYVLFHGFDDEPDDFPLS